MMLKDQLRGTKCAAVRCADDVVKVGSGRSRWADAARAVEALDPTQIECLDSDGAVVRVIELRDEEEEAEEAPQHGASVSPGELATLAKVLGQISDQAAARHEAAYAQAFRAQTDLVRLIAERLNGLERAWARVIAAEYERASAAASTDSEDKSLDGMVDKVLTLGMMKAQKE